jgi:glyceraldehyde-3-phosphate dehydrogenase (NADP+)
MLIAGEWVEGTDRIDVRNPYDGSVVGRVARGTGKDVESALAASLRGLDQMRGLTAAERAAILLRAAQEIESRREDLARLVSREVGKTVREARGEVGRAVETFTLSAEEAKRIHGETVPLDASPAGRGKFGMALRVPVGVVAAVSPFNFPLNLVAHKVGPALAAGNSIVLKPATATPLIALELGRILLGAGLPSHALQIVTGPGAEIGDALVSHPDVRMVTFTGSREVGERISRAAGMKKLTLELGSNSAVIVMDDADLGRAVERIRLGGFAVAGQVCISVQRVIVHSAVYREFLERMVPAVESLRRGDPLDEGTELGPMISEAEAARAAGWIREAVRGGARLECGGEPEGPFLAPAVVTGSLRKSKLWTHEAFAPLVAVVEAADLDEAIRLANDSPYGLQAGVFTERIGDAFRVIREVDVGGVMVNDVPSFRVDSMPYGGVKGSGLGREGVRYAVEEMTELRMVAFDLERAPSGRGTRGFNLTAPGASDSISSCSRPPACGGAPAGRRLCPRGEEGRDLEEHS